MQSLRHNELLLHREAQMQARPSTFTDLINKNIGHVKS